MTQDEREVFQNLQNSVVKKKFLDIFWQSRDPDLTTTENEFRIEFEKRVNFANRYFSTYKKEGWKTDRGRIYILLGQPTEIERTPASVSIPISELWIYSNIKCGSKLKNVKVCFIDLGRDGDFKLSAARSYGIEDLPVKTPKTEGLEFFFSCYFNQEELYGSRTSDIYAKTSKPINTFPMADLQNIIDEFHDHRIFEIPPKSSLPSPHSQQVYSSLLPQFQIDFFQESAYLSYIPITLKLYYRDFLFKKRDGKNYTTIDVLALLFNKGGYLINFIRKRVSFGLSKEESIEELGDKSFTYQLGLMAPSGFYKLQLYVIDRVDKKTNRYIASWAQELNVPHWGKSNISLSSMVLSNNIETIPSNKIYLMKQKQPYILGNHKIIPNISRTFNRREDLSVFFQIFNHRSDADGLNSYKIDYIFYKDSRFFSKPPSQITPPVKGKTNTILVNFKLINFYPGNYTLVVKASDKKTNDVASNKIGFIIK